MFTIPSHGWSKWHFFYAFAMWVCLKIESIPNYSHLVRIMIINHWVIGYTIFRHTHAMFYPQKLGDRKPSTPKWRKLEANLWGLTSSPSAGSPGHKKGFVKTQRVVDDLDDLGQVKLACQ